MFLKKEKQIQGGRLNATADYFKNLKDAAPGEALGPKVAFIGTLNGLTPDWNQTVAEMGSLETEWRQHRQGSSTGKAYMHWSLNLEPGEGPWTPETAREAVQIHLRHQGMENHHAIYAAHKDKPHSHIHIYVCQIRPEPDGKGIYRLAQGASISSQKGSNKAESALLAEAEIRARQGWRRSKHIRWDMTADGKFVQSKPTPKDPDAVRVGVKVQGMEIRTGTKHEKTALAEAGRDIIRQAGNDKAKAVALLAAAGITYQDTDYVDNKGRRHVGGLLVSADVPKGVKVSSLPADCRWIAKEGTSASLKTAVETPIKIEGFADAKAVVKQAVAGSATWTDLFRKLDAANLSFEQTGKAGGRVRFGQGDTDTIKLSEAGTSFLQLERKLGQFSPYAPTLHDSQGKVNASFEKMHGEAGKSLGDNSIGRLPAYTVSNDIIAEPLGDNGIGRLPAYTMPKNLDGNGGNDATIIQHPTIPTIAEVAKTVLLEKGQTEVETLEALASQGITFSREVAIDKKSGKEFTYGKLSRDGEAPITLKNLGTGEDGKALFTLHSLDRQFLTAEAGRILAAHAAEGRTAAGFALTAAGIALVEARGKDKEGREFTYGQLERNGVAIPLSALGRTDKGHSTYSLSSLDRAELRSVALPIIETHAGRGKTAVEFALAAQGITLSEKKEKIEGQDQEIRYGVVERNGVSVTLKALGEKDSKAIYSLGSLERTEREIRQGELRREALPVIEANSNQGKTAIATALAGRGIALVEKTDKIKGEDGKEIEVKYGVLERGDVSVTLKSLGQNDEGKAVHSVGGMEWAEREYRQGELRNAALPIAQAHHGEGWDATVKALASQGIRLSEEPILIKDKASGQEKEVIASRLERDGVTVTLRSLGDKDGKPLFQAREMQRMGLAQDAARILDQHGTYAGAESALAAAGIHAERVRTTFTAPDGEERTATVMRLERDGVTTSTGYAGKAYSVSALDNRLMPEDKARSLYLEARTHRDPVKFLAAKGLTASDVDRIGRVGERVERNIPRKSAPPAAPVQPGGSVIPRSVKELLDQIADSAEAAARIAQANARAASAEHEKRKAEKALAALKSQIRTEERKPARPAKDAGAQAIKENKDMAEGMTHAPTAVKPQAPETTDKEQAKPVANDDQQQAQAQVVEAPQPSGTDDGDKDRIKAEAEREREREIELAQRERERERERMLRERERERM